jgi:PAS domain S-box-containing protein
VKEHRGRESRIVWVAILTAIVVAAYRISIAFLDKDLILFRPYAYLPVDDWVTNFLILWSLALLFSACRLWRSAADKQRELETIIVSVSPDVLLVTDARGLIRLCNPAVRLMFGYEPSDMIGASPDILYSATGAEGGPRALYESLERFGFHIGVASGRRRGGETFPVEILTGSLEGSPGKVVLIRDISERKRAEEQLRRAKEEAEAANRVKTEVLAELAQNYARLKELEDLRDNLTHMIVHDMKNLLFTISGNLEMLQRDAAKGALAAPQGLWADRALDSTEDLVQMVRSLLDISRMESGEMPLAKLTCDLGALVGEAVDRARTRAQEKSLRLQWRPASLSVNCDPDVVSRVVTNILGNALRYSPQSGLITVDLRQEGNRAVVSISDEGCGIPPQYHDRIFRKFARVEAARDGKEFSTGLGLSFCKLAVEAHGGQIGVVSDQGRGSLFWFALPLSA